MIGLEAAKVTEALATMEVGAKEPIISMNIDVGMVEKPSGATFANADLYKILFSDGVELE